MALKKILKLYDYKLPKELIAQKPARPRDSARLLVYNRKTKKIAFDTFANIGKYLPKSAVLVFNQTKVIPARLIVQKPTGGKAEILYIDNDKKLIKVLSNKKLPIGTNISISDGRQKLICFKVIFKKQNFYFLKPSFPVSQLLTILYKYGKTPLPPYLKNSPLSEKQRREQYQTVFAKFGFSVAAPTASLHFTKNLIGKLKKQGITIKYVRLDIGLGTFAPLHEDNIKTNKLHTETYNISKATADFLKTAKKQKRSIIAVGTTAVRTLETMTLSHKLSGATNLFIHPLYNFILVDGIITNFHVPRSSLMMLVASFISRKKLLALYQRAINKRFRFFSFGDGMLIL